MDSDERFKHLASDPRFRNLKKKQRKVEIDDRFKSMFTDEKFTLKYSRDKRGWKNSKKRGENLEKYYALKQDDKDENKNETESKVTKLDVDSADNEESNLDCETKKDYSSDSNEPCDITSLADSDNDKQIDELSDQAEGEEDDEEESASEVSSSSDESESDDDEDSQFLHIQHDWMPLDHDAETASNTSQRLAIQNMDWDRINVQDLYTLINSVRPPRKVRIYVSEYGKERLKREEVEGPPEIVDMPKVDEEEQEYNELKDKMDALKDPTSRKNLANQYEDADEELNPKDEALRERVRKYQLNRMKYYYAIAEFDSVESAELVYKELDGLEFEGSSLEVDLRYVPDDVEFDDNDMIAECDKAPDLATYKAPQFINTALQQTTVKFTWDQTDVERQEKLRKSYTAKELEMDDLDAYLASGTSSEEDEAEEGDDAVSVVTANSEARINKYRQLLKSLDEEASKKKKVDVDIDWDGESHGESADEGDSADSDVDDASEDNDDENDSLYDNKPDEQIDELASESASEAGVSADSSDELDKSETKQLSKREMRKLIRKAKRKEKRDKKRGGDEDDSKGLDDKQNGELDLLVMGDENKRLESFQFNPDDDRFKAVYESALYNIDPSHPNFKRTKAFDLMAEKKRQKRMKKST